MEFYFGMEITADIQREEIFAILISLRQQKDKNRSIPNSHKDDLKFVFPNIYELYPNIFCKQLLRLYDLQFSMLNTFKLYLHTCIFTVLVIINV